MSAASDPVVRLGEICGVHGIKGWVKVRSWTEPRSNLTDYRHWTLEIGGRRRPVQVEDSALAGGRVIAKLSGVDDPEAARSLIGAGVLVRRSELPACAPGEYYWADLEGLEVRTPGGQALGTVAGLIATGANDVLVLSGRGDRLIPFIPGTVVQRVDIAAGVIVVDWDPSYWE